MRTRTIVCESFVSAALLVWTTNAHAQPVAYTDETAFLSALVSQGYPAVQEGFEDDAAWGAVRSTTAGGNYTAPSITNLGITWTASSPNNEITTGSGAARTGAWGFYSLPHGDYANGIGDGFAGTTSAPLVAIGGWIDTNTPPAKLGLFLDGNELNPVDFGDADGLGTQTRFFGVIDAGGFTRFDFRELEGTIGDQKFIFADDFTLALGGTLIDCNGNGVADALDIANETSSDCNLNVVPDECEIVAGSAAPGGPFFCTESCDPDCNINGLLDECEVVVPQSYASGQLSPIGNGSPQSFTITAPPVARSDVLLEFTAYANLGGGPDHITVDINGVSVGAVFGPDGSDCPELLPDAAQIIVPMATFNDAVAGGDAVVNMVARVEVAPDECDLPTYVTVSVTLFVPSDADTNEDGTPDECEAASIPTVSEWGMIVLTALLIIVGTLVLRHRLSKCHVCAARRALELLCKANAVDRANAAEPFVFPEQVEHGGHDVDEASVVDVRPGGQVRSGEEEPDAHVARHARAVAASPPIAE